MNPMIRVALAGQLQDALFAQIALSERLALLITGKPIEPRKLAERFQRDLDEQIAFLDSTASIYGVEDLRDRIEIAKSVVRDIVREIRKA